MKFKFTKLAALLLAGAALFATGCTDYEVDIQKVDKKVDDLANGRVATLENQIATLTATLEKDYETIANHNKDIEALKKQIQDLEKADETTAGEISQLKRRLDAAEAAIEDLTKTGGIIDQIKNQIKVLEDLTKGDWGEQTIKQYIDAVKETLRILSENYAALTAGFPEDKSLVDYIAEKLDDYVLTTTFEEFVKIVGTKEELENMEGTIIGRIAAAEGDVKKLQNALDKITNEEGTGRLDVLENTCTEYFGKVDNILDQLKFADGDLQGYIDGAAQQAYEDACDYVDGILSDIIDQLNDILEDIYDKLYAALERIQSVQYVPDYDDLKITSNMAKMTVPGAQGEVIFTDQPTKITYQFLPAQYAQDVADGIEDFILGWEEWQEVLEYYEYRDAETTGPLTREELKEIGLSGIIAFFDVKPVNTRADDDPDAPKPSFEILSVDKVDTTTGEITFTVLPHNVASAQFAATDIKPTMMYTFDRSGNTLYYPYVSEENGTAQFFQSDGSIYWPSFNIEDVENYRARTAFAAQLRLYNWQTYDSYEDYDWDNCDWERFYEDWDYWPDIITYFIDYENELASPYNVLFPAVTSEIEVLPDVYRPEEDEETGETVLVKATPEYQYLPYTALRGADPCIGEEEDQDPKGYRIYLDQAVPAVSIDGGDPITLEEAAAKGYVIPKYELSETAKFDYDKGTAADVDKNNFVETPEKYAEIEMNKEADLLDRFAAVGNIIKGTYTVAAAGTELPPFDVYGEVEITKSLGSVDVNATIIWNWEDDAEVDHENFYNDAGLPYTRDDYEITIEENDLEKNLDVKLEDFKGLTPKELKVTVTYTNDEGEEVKDEVVDDATVATLIADVAINGEKLTADFTGFKWDAVYTVVAKYELPEALITVNGTLTTIDRNREKVVLGKYGYTFTIGQFDEETGFGYVEADDWYKWESDPLFADIFKAFNSEGVINVVEPDYDFAYDGEQEEFNVAELIGKLAAAKDPGTAKGYIDIKNAADADVYAWTMKTVTTAVLAGELFNSGKTEWQINKENGVADEDNTGDPNLWIGNVLTRNITTYIGEEVEFSFQFNYRVPAYNFLHLRFYTFNTGHAFTDFIMQRALPAEIDGVESPYDAPIWWTQVNPSYFTDVPAEGQTPSQADRVSNRYALADYDVAYINLAELAFNVVDEKDEIVDDADMKELGLTAKFIYTDDELGETDLPEVDQIDPDFLLYQSLWIDNTTFYYRTNEHPYIPALGTLTLTSGGVEFPVATRFEYPKNSVKFPSEKLDYSTYAVVRWTPFKDPKAEGYTMVLDENKVYSVPLFKGMELKDNRPNGTSFYVIKDGEWVVGDAAATATASSKSNGYMKGVKANDAYHITTTFDYSEVNLPAELKKLLTVEEIEGVPYIVFDYTSEVVFHGVVTIPVVVKLENPWQETLVFKYNFVIKGVGD